MDTIITMRNTKSEMFEHIRALELRCTEAAHERMHLRERISILEGSAALRQPVPAPTKQVRINGLLHNVVVEQTGQCTRKRFVPVPGQGV